MVEVVKAAPLAKAGFSSDPKVSEVVSQVLLDVERRGDAAVREYSERFDNWAPRSFRLSEAELDEIVSAVPQDMIDDLSTAQDNVKAFAEHQLSSLADFEVEIQPGVMLGQKNIPIGAAGAYIPGGRYPLVASAHMTVLTAKVAGVSRAAACTPPINGEIPAATIAAMRMAGADEIYLLGGVQAVAAMAIGTETIAPVDMISGPGNAYVAEAKRQLFGRVGIDLFAGPTETLIIADESADPFMIAVDLLSQAEHGPDSPAVLVCTDREVAKAATEMVDRLLIDLPTKGNAGPAWRDFGEVLLVESLDEAWEIGNEIASEHVQILTKNPREALTQLTNYGALFLGEGTCVTYGDKCIGTNHTLPTRKAARYTGGLWVGKYLKTVTYQEVTNPEASARLGELAARTSRIESFEGHARSGDIRAARYSGQEIPWATWAWKEGE